MTYPPKTENLTLSKQARVSSWHPYTDQVRGEKCSEAELEAKKMATTLGAEKKRSERQEKMTKAPIRTAATEPGQHTTETKKIELNTLCSNTINIFN